jgi:hypothetical protein
MTNRTLDLSYLAQKLDQARSSLLPPHSEGVVEAFATSMFMCNIVEEMLEEVVAARLSEESSKMAQTILDALNTDGIEDPSGAGTLAVKIRGMSSDDLLAYSRTLDTLATWAILRGWGGERA